MSLHSWSTPTVSRDTLARSPQASTVGFEAKILLDGVCVAYVIMPLCFAGLSELADERPRGTLLSADPPWPQMIGE